jgi:hypothetical protein
MKNIRNLIAAEHNKNLFTVDSVSDEIISALTQCAKNFEKTTGVYTESTDLILRFSKKILISWHNPFKMQKDNSLNDRRKLKILVTCKRVY